MGCKKELNLKQASFICEACLNNIILNSGVQCHICGLRNKNNACRFCRKKTFLNGLHAAGKYQDPVLREAIHQFKYQEIESLKKPLTELLIKYLKKENLIEKLANSILTPIPLTWSRKLRRGFNQSELLAKELAPILNCLVVNLLKRQKFSTPQAKISDWQKRKENISGVFALNISNIHSLSPFYPTSDVGKLRVVLIDDVATSVATLEEAARVLKKAGVKEVYGLVVARG